jgi:hypothetical protein
MALPEGYRAQTDLKCCATCGLTWPTHKKGSDT